MHYKHNKWAKQFIMPLDIAFKSPTKRVRSRSQNDWIEREVKSAQSCVAYCKKLEVTSPQGEIGYVKKENWERAAYDTLSSGLAAALGYRIPRVVVSPASK